MDPWAISYHDRKVEKAILGLPATIQARYLHRADMMAEMGPNLGMPHTRALGRGLFEQRIQGKEGIARVFFCLPAGQRIVMLHAFIKKSQKTPDGELETARRKLAEAERP